MVHLKGEPVEFSVPEYFNLSEILVDRHIKSGKGHKVAYYHVETGRAYTYS